MTCLYTWFESDNVAFDITNGTDTEMTNKQTNVSECNQPIMKLKKNTNSAVLKVFKKVMPLENTGNNNVLERNK